MRKYFGTDGIRGTANKGIMTAETALRLGLAAGTFFIRKDSRRRVIIGKDTRLSGYLFETAVTAGFLSAGMEVFLVGPMPTPAVAMLVKSMRADLGVMISASHNPYYDNGLKLFGPDGHKLSDQVEAKIEEIMTDPKLIKLADPEKVGRAKRIDDAPGRYIEFIKNSFPRSLKGLKLVVDCANGAAYHLGEKIFWELGAEVIEIGSRPNGVNINLDCGSNHLEQLSAAVIENQADLGIALDGDADRLHMVDEKGNVIDGDKILALIACHLKSQNKLKDNTVVATTMSNLAFEEYLNSQGIEVIRTQVGDRYVVAKMEELGLSLGGEQSGHIVVGNYSTTGDGLVAALQMLALIQDQDKPISVVADIFTPLPQVLRNVKIKNAADIMKSSSFQSVIKSVESKLGNRGRLLVRKSGTEDLIRIMCESKDEELMNKTLDEIESALV
ncbi:MAG: phosphoglucosamine mutase [Rickettsiales bacterium]|jgi:phosphoglucosamine mutase|nr:phosphoglucosamine mutase [Rickettsiales bacterium]